MAQTTTEERIQRLRRRWAALKRDRDGWFSVGRDIQTFLAPDTGRFQGTNRKDNGHRNDQKIIDGSATRSWRTLAAGWQSGTSSPSQPWFELAPAEAELADDLEVRAWLTRCRDVIRDIFSRSNVYRGLHSLREENAAYGTNCGILMPDFDTVLHLNTLTFGEFALATDHKGVINTMYRDMSMTVDQMVRQFGLDACSAPVRNAYRNGHYDQTFSVIHAIEPRPVDERVGRVGAIRAPWRETYFELTQDSRDVLWESGYDQFPVLASRWIVNGNNVYGTSPGRDALGDIKQLQHQQLRKGQAIDYQTRPPLQGPARLKGNNGALLPGGYSPIEGGDGSNGIRTVFETRLDLGAMLADIQDIRERISRTFYEDLFRMIADMDRSGITARQIAEQHAEKMALLGPVVERDQTECLGPLVEMAFQRAAEVGMLPEPPERMRGRQLRVEYVSVLAQAQKQSSAAAIDRLVGTAASLAQVWPDAVDKINPDEVIDEYADVLGTPPRITRTTDEVDQLRQQRAQQQQAIQQQAMAAEQAKIDKDQAAAEASRAKVSGGTDVPAALADAQFLG